MDRLLATTSHFTSSHNPAMRNCALHSSPGRGAATGSTSKLGPVQPVARGAVAFGMFSINITYREFQQ